MFSKLFPLLTLLLTACVAVPPEDNSEEVLLRPSIIPAIQTSYNYLQADKYEEALTILDKLIADNQDNLTPYELATLLELRANALINLDDQAGAKSDLEEAFSLNAFPPERRAQLGRYIEEIDDEKPLYRQPCLRIPPKMPAECIGVGSKPDADGSVSDVVEVVYDIDIYGAPDNVRVLSSTNECLNEPTLVAVRRWRFEPVVKNKQPVRLEGQTTQITFAYSIDG